MQLTLKTTLKLALAGHTHIIRLPLTIPRRLPVLGVVRGNAQANLLVGLKASAGLKMERVHRGKEINVLCTACDGE